MMEKMKMHSPNLTQENIARIREMFPGCVTEAQSEDGKLKLAVDFDQLRQELSESIVEGPQERYHLNWPGKREALLTANAPIAKTLRPCREESVDFDTTKNLFIEGDNLEALKLLQETYLGKVKMIYIDPPYNTGNDFIYKDDFAVDKSAFELASGVRDEQGNKLFNEDKWRHNSAANGRFHSDWLSMMYARLRFARNLLRTDGVIFISIDDNEQAQLKLLCDEIFGVENCLATLVWKKKYTGGKHTKGYVDLHEYILAYANSAQELSEISICRPDDEKGKFIEEDEFVTERGKFYVRPLKSNLALRRTLIYPVTAPDGSILETQWLVSRDTLDRLFIEKRAEFRQKRDGVYQLYRKYYEKDGGGNVKPPSLIDRFPNTEAKIELKQLFDVKEGRDNIFYTVKPLGLIKYLIEPFDEPEAIFLDFFAGSGTTAHAVMELNSISGGSRSYITVQIPEPIEMGEEYKSITDIAKERIRRAGKKILEGECHEGWNKDIGFRVLKVDSSNMADVYYAPDAIEQGQLKIFTDNIKPDRKPEDLLFQVLLDWGVDLSLPIRKDTIQGKAVFFVNEPPYDLVACFDTGVNEDLVKELARFEPLRVVFRDTGFVSDAVKINVKQIFKQMSPGTEVKSI